MPPLSPAPSLAPCRGAEQGTEGPSRSIGSERPNNPSIPNRPSTSDARCVLSAALVATLGLIGCASTAPTHSQPPHPYGDRVVGVKAPSTPGITFVGIDRLLRAGGHEVTRRGPGMWRVSIDKVLVMVLAEDDRIRILAPIFALGQLDEEPGVRNALMMRLLQSNFERAVDARYAVYGGIVFATVTHPRLTLHADDLDGFLEQVVNLHKNTFRSGPTGYSSNQPTPDSVEIDPRQDETLRAPERFQPRPKAEPEPLLPPKTLRDEQRLM